MQSSTLTTPYHAPKRALTPIVPWRVTQVTQSKRGGHTDCVGGAWCHLNHSLDIDTPWLKRRCCFCSSVFLQRKFSASVCTYILFLCAHSCTHCSLFSQHSGNNSTLRHEFYIWDELTPHDNTCIKHRVHKPPHEQHVFYLVQQKLVSQSFLIFKIIALLRSQGQTLPSSFVTLPSRFGGSASRSNAMFL